MRLSSFEFQKKGVSFQMDEDGTERNFRINTDVRLPKERNR